MDEAYGILSANGLNITDYSSTKLTGTVNVSEKRRAVYLHSV